MKLLLDENLSRRIVPFLQAAFPGSTQIALLGLESASDSEIWRYAKDIRKMVDLLIATWCIANDMLLLHNDRDFEPFEKHLGLRAVNI